MVSAREMQELIQAGETSRIEFKLELEVRTPDQKVKFIKDVMAFANRHEAETAFILVGVDNAGSVCGPSAPLPDDADLPEMMRIATGG